MLIEGNKKRLLGTFYTPQPLARKLVSWALAGKAGRVLDPSFGGCSFLDAAEEELASLGVADRLSMIVGVDIDPDAKGHAAHLVRSGMPSDNLVIRDFFSVDSPREEGLFDCVVGNPPYVRHHWIASPVKERATAVAKQSCPDLNGRASLWAYFLVHARSFLRPGGRLAFLLPGSALDADYAVAVRTWLEREFAFLTLAELPDRIFDADERTVILLADGAGQGPGSIHSTRLSRMSDLDEHLAVFDRHDEKLPGGPSQAQISRLLSELNSLPRLRPLSDLGQVRLGVVTGANSFFVRRQAELEHLNDAGVKTLPIVSRSSWLSMATWRTTDQDSVLSAQRPSQLLLIDGTKPLNDVMAAEVAIAVEQSLHLRTKCAARTPWYSLRDAAVPDAFLPYMGAAPRHIVLNRSGATATNAIHRIWWKSRTPRQAVAMASWTSLWNLACEQGGRTYGGGVLKIEPGRAQSLLVPIVPEAGPYLPELDRLARDGRRSDARDLADQLVLVAGLGLSKRDVSRVRREANRLSRIRSRPSPRPKP